MDEKELEAALRAGLSVHAEEAEVTAPVAARARAEVSRRRRTRWSVGAAAAAVVLVAGGVALVTSRDDGGVPVGDDPVATGPGATADQQWRTEHWGGLAVDVPADWGYGGAPLRSDGEALACYPAAAIAADGSRVTGKEERTLGWVGRPIMMTDVCAGYPWIEHSPQEEPAAPYVWLGAAVEPGTVDYANGYVQETVEVAGVALTVASDDAGLRQRILDSARQTSTTDPRACRASWGRTIPSGRSALTREGRGDLLTARVCAYRAHPDISGEFLLAYAAELAPGAAATAYQAQEGAPVVTHDDACMGDLAEFVVVEAVYDDPFGRHDLVRRGVFTMGCGGEVSLGDGPLTHLVPEGVEPWAVGGIPAVVRGPTDGSAAMGDYFIGTVG